MNHTIYCLMLDFTGDFPIGRRTDTYGRMF